VKDNVMLELFDREAPPLSTTKRFTEGKKDLSAFCGPRIGGRKKRRARDRSVTKCTDIFETKASARVRRVV
jgi:hypothetical protein